MNHGGVTLLFRRVESKWRELPFSHRTQSMEYFSKYSHLRSRTDYTVLVNVAVQREDSSHFELTYV